MSRNVRKFIGLNLAVVLALGAVMGVTLLGAMSMKAHAQEGAGTEAIAAPRAPLEAGAAASAFWAAAISVCVSCVAAGIAVGMTGSAAIGAVSERPELMGRTILFVGLAEGIAIYGLIIAIMILGKV